VQDYLIALKLLHEKLLPHFESTFSEAVGGDVKAEIAGVEHTTFENFINSEPPPRVFYSSDDSENGPSACVISG